jgi:hypothetical protein
MVTWTDITALVQLLEWRAARIVQELARNPDVVDASMNQRVSKAVTEAFVAAQVAEIVADLTLPSTEREVVTDVYKLVSSCLLSQRHLLKFVTVPSHHNRSISGRSVFPSTLQYLFRTWFRGPNAKSTTVDIGVMQEASTKCDRVE